jgi:hypothetical protein
MCARDKCDRFEGAIRRASKRGSKINKLRERSMESLGDSPLCRVKGYV